MTVTGPVAAEKLGATLAHEHLYCDLSVSSGRPDNVVTDIDAMIGEMAFFRAAGGCSIVEASPEGIGRNPAALRRISEASGVQIISGISLYEAKTWPAWARGADVGTLTDHFVREIEEGTDGVRAGILGEVFSRNAAGTDFRAYRLEEHEVRLFQAAAAAHRRTGVAITTHACEGRGGHAQLDALERAGADLTRVAIGHCDTHWHPDPELDLAYYLPILERGAYCEFDLIGWTQLMPDEVRADRIAELTKRGHAEKITLSTDTCRRSQLRIHGGRGFDYLWRTFLPKLRERGVSEAQITAMMVTAPSRLLGGNGR